MKVLLVNGSPKANGNTARALAEVAEQLNAEGIDTEVFQLGAKPIRDCIGCGQCGGTSTTFDVLNKYFTINQMPVVASTYWNNVFGRVPGDANGDAEGLATMRNIGKNMAWLLRCIEAGQAAGINAPEADRATTNFIR